MFTSVAAKIVIQWFRPARAMPRWWDYQAIQNWLSANGAPAANAAIATQVNTCSAATAVTGFNLVDPGLLR